MMCGNFDATAHVCIGKCGCTILHSCYFRRYAKQIGGVIGFDTKYGEIHYESGKKKENKLNLKKIPYAALALDRIKR